MELTQEQYDIINSIGNIKINAVAGSGKTTTIIEYAKARPKTAKILYLAFNKSVKLEAIKKFTDIGLENVKVETAHSLAYKHIVFKYDYKIRAQGYKTSEIAELLGLQGGFVSTSYDYIEKQTRLLLAKMDKGEIDVTHDFYLKKFQLSNPTLYYDYILFDEGQDASPAMLDVFFNQKATKVIVGDTHQQIYGWRYAVNSLEKADYKTFNLSTSFRFNQDIANLAMEMLKLKKYIKEEPKISITGKGTANEIVSKVVIARTNLGLLVKAIEYVTEKKKVKNIYFEGNINSYTYADEGASLFDVLNLHNRKYHLIKDKLIKQMKSLEELEEYIDKTEDVQLGMLVEIVKEYGNNIPDIIKKIKEKHIESDKKEEAEMIFSTVHRCKGMEYDTIQLVNDFITEETLEKLNKDKDKILNADKINEEINLLYVAVTRTKNSIHIPSTLMPNDLSPSTKIHIMKVLSKEEKEELVVQEQKAEKKEPANGKTYSVEKVREKHKDAYKPWTQALDEELTIMYCEGINVRDMAKHFRRTNGAIWSRIKKLELEELYG